MQSLKMYIYKTGQEKPEKVITMPISSLHIAVKLLPKKVMSTLEREGIDLSGCRELAKEKGIKGTLIEIENSVEKMVISID
ncbi:MAG: hypothetical protein JRJ02_09305 [Deltaproteobacteria bacterium]|nr:hypothetical protein [Deltaproteobacteria bacterium]